MNTPREKSRHPFLVMLRDFSRQRMGVAGACLIGVMVFLAVTADWIAPQSYDEISMEESERAPSIEHWFGTDRFGRDIFSRVIYGARVSVFVGVISQGIALLIGIPLGAFAGYIRGYLDSFIMWIINVFWSFPYLLLVLAMNLAIGRYLSGEAKAFIAIGLVSWVPVARLVRGQILSERENAYVEAGRAFGFSVSRIVFRHLLPNVFAPLMVVITLGFAQAIIAEAALSFLGLGVEPPKPSWGAMIEDGYGYLSTTHGWWIYLFPGLAIAVAVLGFNLVGDGLRDALDPRLRGETMSN